ncbi:DNA ligase D [Chitinophaga defluvii]|uniref:DNA ligase (ATP) n=1 Tax=Chitinophaga defluvii TaxID=3163343 RepID=A0ABV2TCC0_9BACT
MSKAKAQTLAAKDLNAEITKEKEMAAGGKPKGRQESSNKGITARQINQWLKQAPEKPFYSKLKPMLATLVDEPFDSEGWLYEIKWDGYRAVSFIHQGEVSIKSRNDKSFSEKYYPVFDALKAWKVSAVIDGEIVVVNEDGTANFGALQNWRSEADGRLLYYVFDLLWYKGRELSELPLTERREILKSILPVGGVLRYSMDFNTGGTAFLAEAKRLGLEGIMAKRADSTYVPGDRSRSWLKIKANKRQEVVIGGYTRNVDTSKPFSSLLVGVYEKGKLKYTGKIGTGFNDEQQKEMMAQFAPLVTSKPPFTEEPDVNKPSRFRPNPPKATATWLKPKLVCEVSFAEMTSDGVMRHPSFQGMREDKSAGKVVLEKEADTVEVVRGTKKKNNGLTQFEGKNTGKTLLNPNEETQVKKVNGQELKFTNLSKVFWPKEKYTKRDLINYYHQMAPFILPYLKERPQSMNRYPNGIEGKSFYFKNISDQVQGWMDTYLYHSDADHSDKHYLVGKDEATLLYMAGLGCIEMNPWNSTVKKPNHPTYCIIDLDPDKNTFEQVIQAAQVTKGILDDMGVKSYPKTSGSTGMHIYIPLGNKYTYEQSKEFARIIVTLVHRQIPKYTSLERTISDRKGKMYLDFLQNRPHATIASAYSLRPKPGATVSMPLDWSEVKKGLKMTDFTIKNAVARVQEMGDIFKPVLGKGIDLKQIISSYSRSK